MASYNPPVKNAEYIFYVSLRDRANTKIFKSNPTLASGDAKVSKDGGALANLTTLPAVTPAGSKSVKITLSAAEMNADNVTVILSDASGDEWCDLTVNIQTIKNGHQFDNLLGSDATTELAAKKLTIINSAGDALYLEASGGNGHGLNAAGNGSGSGIRAQGGATGHGVAALGGTNGNGIEASASTGTGQGINASGGATGGDGFRSSGGTGGHGIYGIGNATGHGIYGSGGTTSGSGLRAEASSGSGHGLHALAGGSGNDVEGDIPVAVEGVMDANLVSIDEGFEGEIPVVIEETVDANVVSIAGDAAVMQQLAVAFGCIAIGQAVTGTLTATEFTTTLTTATADALVGRLLTWRATGALEYQQRQITDYVADGGVITVSPAFTGAPSNNDWFSIA